jgi:hypothetical protein
MNEDLVEEGDPSKTWAASGKPRAWSHYNTETRRAIIEKMAARQANKDFPSIATLPMDIMASRNWRAGCTWLTAKSAPVLLAVFL